MRGGRRGRARPGAAAGPRAGGPAGRPVGGGLVPDGPSPPAGALARPVAVAVLAGLFLLAPLLQAATLAGFRALNFAADRPWNYVAYGLAAPWVAWLLWRRRPRARFAAYVFLTHEAARGLHFGHRGAVAVALAVLALLQLPAVRRWSPSLRPSDFRARPAGGAAGTVGGRRDSSEQ